MRKGDLCGGQIAEWVELSVPFGCQPTSGSVPVRSYVELSSAIVRATSIRTRPLGPTPVLINIIVSFKRATGQVGHFLTHHPHGVVLRWAKAVSTVSCHTFWREPVLCAYTRRFELRRRSPIRSNETRMLEVISRTRSSFITPRSTIFVAGISHSFAIELVGLDVERTRDGTAHVRPVPATTVNTISSSR